MFLSRGDSDLGVAFQTHPGSLSWTPGEAKDPALLSSRHRCLLEPTEWPKGNQAPCGVWREDSGLLSRPCRKRRPSSRDDRGVLLVFSSCGASVRFLTRCDGKLRELQETRVATREESGVLGFPSRRGLTPRGSLECNPEIPAFPGEEY